MPRPSSSRRPRPPPIFSTIAAGVLGCAHNNVAAVDSAPALTANGGVKQTQTKIIVQGAD